MNDINSTNTTYYTGMKAVYTPSALTAKQPNPLYEALPPFDVDRIEERLTAGADFFDPAWRALSKSDRLQLFKGLELDMYIYRKRDKVLATGVMQALASRYLRMSPLDSRYFIPGGRPSAKRADNVGSFGVAGSGKTNSLEAVFKLIPEVICHDKYHDRPFEIKKQVPILRTVCPTSGGAVALYDGIIAKFCVLTGERYPKSRSKTHGETMLMQIIETAGIGAVAIDEASNVLQHGALRGQIMGGFTRLNEEWGIPLILAGEETAAKTFESFFHAARRASGIGSWSRMKNDEEYHDWFRSMLSYYLTEEPWEYTPALANFFHSYSQGVIGAIVKSFLKAQEVAIENDHKAVRTSDLEHAIKYRLDLQTAGLEFLKEERARRAEELRKARHKANKARGQVSPNEETTDLSAVTDMPRPPLFGEPAG